MITFVFGFPLALFLGMKARRQLIKMRIRRTDIHWYTPLFEAGYWRLCSEEDIVMLKMLGTLRAAAQTTIQKVNKVYRKIKSRNALGEGTGQKPPQRKTIFAMREMLWGKHPQLEAGAVQPYVDVYMQRDTFTLVQGVVSNLLERLRERDKIATRAKELQIEDNRRRRRSAGADLRTNDLLDESMSGQLHLFVESQVKISVEKFSIDRTQNVILFKKEDQGDAGLITMRDVTMLDEFNTNKVLGQFREPFEDPFYFWQCYEIVRRMMQTGLIVIVELMLGETASIIYAVLVAVFAVILHQRYSPYRADALDELQLAILINQYVVQFLILCILISEGSSTEVIGIVLLVLQFMIMMYAMTLIGPAFGPVFRAIFLKAQSIWTSSIVQDALNSVRRRDSKTRIVKSRHGIVKSKSFSKNIHEQDGDLAIGDESENEKRNSDKEKRTSEDEKRVSGDFALAMAKFGGGCLADEPYRNASIENVMYSTFTDASQRSSTWPQIHSAQTTNPLFNSVIAGHKEDSNPPLVGHNLSDEKTNAAGDEKSGTRKQAATKRVSEAEHRRSFRRRVTEKYYRSSLLMRESDDFADHLSDCVYDEPGGSDSEPSCK